MSTEAFLWIGDVTVLYRSVTDEPLSDEWRFAELATIEGVPRQQFIGQAGRKLSLSVEAHVSLGMNPEETIRGLRALGDQGEPFAVQYSTTGEVVGWFVLSAVSQENAWKTPQGELLSVTLRISLKPERAPETVIDADEPEAVEGNVTGTETEPDVIDLDREYTDVEIEEILRR